MKKKASKNTSHLWIVKKNFDFTSIVWPYKENEKMNTLPKLVPVKK